jgi:hypothetical protein
LATHATSSGIAQSRHDLARTKPAGLKSRREAVFINQGFSGRERGLSDVEGCGFLPSPRILYITTRRRDLWVAVTSALFHFVSAMGKR